MDKPHISTVDEYGIKEYRPAFLIALMLLLLYSIIALFACPLLWFEAHADGANITNYTDAFWTLQMSASTIGFGDHFPVTFGGRMIIASMFYIGIGVTGSIGGVLFGWIMSFGDTAIKNRELRRQNAQIIEQTARANELNEAILAKLDRI